LFPFFTSVTVRLGGFDSAGLEFIPDLDGKDDVQKQIHLHRRVGRSQGKYELANQSQTPAADPPNAIFTQYSRENKFQITNRPLNPKRCILAIFPSITTSPLPLYGRHLSANPTLPFSTILTRSIPILVNRFEPPFDTQNF
jgi:hypothetical protein